MAVISALVPAAGMDRLNSNLLGMSTDAEVIDRTSDGVYVDLSGTQERALRSLLGTGAQVLDVTFYRPGPKGDGTDGDGIPNDLNESGQRMNVRGIMGKPKF